MANISDLINHVLEKIVSNESKILAVDRGNTNTQQTPVAMTTTSTITSMKEDDILIKQLQEGKRNSDIRGRGGKRRKH